MHVDGLGYVVIGASPGHREGYVSVDPADLDNGLVRYLGGEGPQWSPHNVLFDGAEVLVVIVEPPANGHPIFTLRKGYSPEDRGVGSPEGTIFVRSGTKTQPARSADIQMLQRRLLAGSLKVPSGPDLALTISGCVAVFDGEAASRLIDAESDRRTDELLHAGVPHPSESWMKYVHEVTAWGQEWSRAIRAQMHHMITELDYRGFVTVAVENLSSSNLSSVEVVLTLPVGSPIEAFDENGAEAPDFPAEPRVPSKLGLPSLLFGSDPVLPYFRSTAPPDVEDYGTYVERAENGSTRIRLCCGDVRPRQTVHETAFFVASGAVDEADLAVEWTATCTSLDGVRRGNVSLPPFSEVDTEGLVLAAIEAS